MNKLGLIKGYVYEEGKTMDLYIRWSNSKGRWKFGYSKQFEIIMGTQANFQPHHLIPQEFFDKFVGPMRSLIESGFHPFMKINGINVPEKILGNSFHLGSHPKYSDWAYIRLNQIINKYPDDLFAAATKFCEEAKYEINYAIQYLETGKEAMTLNKYFDKYVLNGPRPPLP